MKRYLVLGLVALVVGISAGWASAYLSIVRGTELFVTDPALLAEGPDAVPPASHAQVQVVNGERYTFGEMLVGGKMSHTFKIRNAGSSPLTLKLEETTCKCTLTDFDSATVAPQETIDVTLEWEAKSPVPDYSQAAIIRTNDPDREYLRLEVDGVVEEAVRLMPMILQFQNVTSDSQAERVIRAYATRQAADMEVLGVEFGEGPLAEHLEYEIRELTREQLLSERRAIGGRQIIVRLKPGLPTGKLEGTMRVLLNVPEQPVAEIPISGNVISDISVVGRGVRFDSQRNALFLGTVKQSEGAVAELRILIKGANRDNVELEIADIDPPIALRATLGNPTKGDKLVTVPLIVEVPAGSPILSRLGVESIPAGRILIRAKNANTKEIPIDVEFAVN